MAPSSELAVHHVGPTILGGVIFYPGDQAAQVVAGWREAIAHAPDELTSMINLTAAPPLPFLPEAVHGKRVAVVIACYAGDIDSGEAAVASLRRLGDPIADVLAPMHYLALQQLLDPLWEAGPRITSPRSSWMACRILLWTRWLRRTEFRRSRWQHASCTSIIWAVQWDA